MRQLIIDSLEYLLENTNDREVGIFETYREREEVTVSVNDEDEQCERTAGEGETGIENGCNPGNEQEEAEVACEGDPEEQETTREVTTTIRRDNSVRILTVEGAQFVNATLDAWVAKRSTDYFMNELFKVGDAKYPNLNLFNVLDESGVTYYDADKELFDICEEAFVLEYPNKDDADIDWIRDEDGVPYEPLSPERYVMVWKRIIKASRRLENNKVSCTKQLTKSVNYWSNINLAYDNQGRLMRKSGATGIKLADFMKVSILKPKWRIPTDIFCREEAERNWSRTDIIAWLCSPIDSNDTDVNQVVPSGGAGKPGSRMDKIAKQNK